MKKIAQRLVIALYQEMPEWMVRNAAFFVIGVAWGMGFVFLSLRPDLRRARRALRRNRRLVGAFEAASIMAVAQERGVRITIAGLLFEFGSDGLRPAAKDRLSRVAGVLGREGRGRKVMVEGHSDAIGAELFNLDLSRRRAAAVAQELKRAGVAAALVSAAGYGSKYPVAPNEGSDGRDDPAGRARTRRVEILVLD